MTAGTLLFPGGDAGMHGWAMATAAVVSASCALVGTLLVVRRMSLLGDAISHAVLPGIAAAMLAGGRPGGPLVFCGAVAAALVTVWLTQGLRAAGGPAEDSGAGIVFTSLFAAGVVLVTVCGPGMHLDACALQGDLAFVPFDTLAIGVFEVPRAWLSGVVVLVALLAAAAATWRMQVFVAFDAAAARAAGVPVGVVTTGLLAATSLATVSGFEAVGAILVVAMLVVPAAAAELLVHRLHHVAAVAVLLSIAAACIGYVSAWHWNTSAAGMIAVVLGMEYAVAVAVAPEDGLLARLVNRMRFGWRVACEDRLAAIWRSEEIGGVAAAQPAGTLVGRAADAWLRATGRTDDDKAGRRLSPRGRREAELVVRSHRLWEAWLGRHADLPVDHLHPPAEWVEHHLGAAVRRRIEAEMEGQESDPHGRGIPPEA